LFHIKSSEETFEEELTWSVDNQISVPPKFKTKAELVIKEDDYTSHFKTESQFRGKVHVTLRNKKDNTPITTITGDVKQIFTKDKGFRVDKTGIIICFSVCYSNILPIYIRRLNVICVFFLAFV
jgi:hypothetical protein